MISSKELEKNKMCQHEFVTVTFGEHDDLHEETYCKKCGVDYVQPSRTEPLEDLPI